MNQADGLSSIKKHACSLGRVPSKTLRAPKRLCIVGTINMHCQIRLSIELFELIDSLVRLSTFTNTRTGRDNATGRGLI
jgi:hypothetical protein